MPDKVGAAFLWSDRKRSLWWRDRHNEEMETPIWQPSQDRIAEANLTRFIARLREGGGGELSSYKALHEFSLRDPQRFWATVWDYCGIRGDAGGRVLAEGADMRDARFFPDARLNFAENLLCGPDAVPAIVSVREDGMRQELSNQELRAAVSQMQQALRSAGVGPGDRVAAWLPNVPEAVIALLATASIGATFSSTSPDFGVQGVLDRFGQIEPSVLIAVDGYCYGGKTHDCLVRLGKIRAGLPSVETVVVVPYVSKDPDLANIPGAILWPDFLSSHDAIDVDYALLPFDQPLVILYSSGTTGAPKCIVHRAGGVLIQHLKEHQLHCDIRPRDRVLYFTTTGWMMWNWLVSALACQATIVLFDGSPFYPSPAALVDVVETERVTLFGTSAKWIDAVRKEGLRPVESHDLLSLRTITSTGSPLSPEGFDYIYDAVCSDVHLASIAGGTDLCGCFVLGDPTAPLWRGEIQCAALGMAVEVYDAHGQCLSVGEKGELVCTRPFPSMPLAFWGDADGSRYQNTYFARFPGVWHHGDYIAQTEHGGYVIYGRSDATLNPGGVRIGTAEIYRQVEQLDKIAEAIVVGQDWDGDTRVVLFVRLAEGAELDDALAALIRDRIRAGASPRHVPAKVLAVQDIPRTKSGKITELAVRDVVCGRPVSNTEALANPEALEYFRDRPELQT